MDPYFEEAAALKRQLKRPIILAYTALGFAMVPFVISLFPEHPTTKEDTGQTSAVYSAVDNLGYLEGKLE